MNPKTKLSVIIPTLNRPNDLAGVVKSIFNQSYLPNELIIVDQSIGLESYNNIQDLFSKVKPSIKLIYIHDSKINGLVSAKHHGVQSSSGNIISFLEDDETLSTNYLKNVVSVFEENEKIRKKICNDVELLLFNKTSEWL